MPLGRSRTNSSFLREQVERLQQVQTSSAEWVEASMLQGAQSVQWDTTDESANWIVNPYVATRKKTMSATTELRHRKMIETAELVAFFQEGTLGGTLRAFTNNEGDLMRITSGLSIHGVAKVLLINHKLKTMQAPRRRTKHMAEILKAQAEREGYKLEFVPRIPSIVTERQVLYYPWQTIGCDDSELLAGVEPEVALLVAAALEEPRVPRRPESILNEAWNDYGTSIEIPIC